MTSQTVLPCRPDNRTKPSDSCTTDAGAQSPTPRPKDPATGQRRIALQRKTTTAYISTAPHNHHNNLTVQWSSHGAVHRTPSGTLSMGTSALRVQKKNKIPLPHDAQGRRIVDSAWQLTIRASYTRVLEASTASVRACKKHVRVFAQVQWRDAAVMRHRSKHDMQHHTKIKEK